MLVFAIIVIAVSLIAIVIKLSTPSKAAAQQKAKAKAESQFTPEQLKFLKTVGGMYSNNEAKHILDIYVACGMPADVAYSKNSELITQHIPFEKHSGPYNVFETYALAVDKRFQLRNSKLIAMSPDTYGINLHRGEAVYHAIYRAALFQEKTTVTNITYSGMMWRSGLLRAGNLSAISNEVTRFTQLDYGKVLFTNERIIFIGKQKNVTKQINIDDILSCNLYQDGVIVNVPNKKPLLFKFDTYQDFDILDVSDQVNQFILVVNRMMAHDYDRTLNKPAQATNAYANKNLADILMQKNYDLKIEQILTCAKAGERIAASTIQRELAVGYNRATGIIIQLKSIGLMNINGEWTVNAEDTEAIAKYIEKAQTWMPIKVDKPSQCD